MGQKQRLYEKARNSPGSLSFKELCRLAGYAGYTLNRQKGSHKFFTHPTAPTPMNFQRGKNGEAKVFQVRQLLDSIDRFDLWEDNNG